MKEIYKKIHNFVGYEVSNLGNIKSTRFNKERILKPISNGNGYYKIILYQNKKPYKFYIHKLVILTFNKIPLNLNNLVVDHINNIKTDNRLCNLQYITNRLNSSKDKKNKTSKYTGVSWNKNSNKWVSHIRINNKKKHLGLFINELDAYNKYLEELNKIK